MTFRTGRHVGRTIYAMLGDEPGDGDQLVGMMDTVELADMVVFGLNALPVEGNTPLDSPAGCPRCGTILNAERAACADPWHSDNRAVLQLLREQLAAWRSADLEGYDPGDLAEAAEALLDRLDAAPAGEVSGDVVEAIMDTIHAYPGPVAGRTREHVEKLIRDYAAGQRAEGVEEGRRRAGEPAPVPPPVDALEEILKLAERLAVHRSDAARDADRGRASAQQHHERAASVRLLIAIRVEDVRAAGVEEGRRRQAGKVEELQLLLDHAEQYARDLQDNGDVPGRAEILTEAYWKLREHASALRSTEVYRKASERKEGTLHESPAFQRYRWLEATARGIEDGAHDLAEMLGVEEHEIERPAATDG